MTFSGFRDDDDDAREMCWGYRRCCLVNAIVWLRGASATVEDTRGEEEVVRGPRVVLCWGTGKRWSLAHVVGRIVACLMPALLCGVC